MGAAADCRHGVVVRFNAEEERPSTYGYIRGGESPARVQLPGFGKPCMGFRQACVRGHATAGFSCVAGASDYM